MKILIITTNRRYSAPGIVFERLIDGLSKHHIIDVLTAEMETLYDLSSVRNILSVKKVDNRNKVNRILTIVFNTNPVDIFWAKKSLVQIKKRKLYDYDLVFS